MKTKFKVFFIALLAASLLITPMAFGKAWRGAQDFYGDVTFHQDVTAKKNATIEGYLSANAYSNVFYVGSTTGADVPHYGTSWEKPFATIDYALTKCTANYGDVIYLLPGHNEGVDAAGDITIDVAGVTIIGIGNGSLMPTIDFDTSPGSVSVTAANVSIYNVRFRPSTSSIVVGLDLSNSADSSIVEYCKFGDAETATDEFTLALQTNDATNYVKILHNEFAAGAQSATAAIKFNKDTDGTVVRGNWITGNYSTAPILGATTASTNLLIDSNWFFTGGTADTFNLVAASTGIISNNMITMNATSASAAMDIGKCLAFKNWFHADDDTSGAYTANIDYSMGSITASNDD